MYKAPTSHIYSSKTNTTKPKHHHGLVTRKRHAVFPLYFYLYIHPLLLYTSPINITKETDSSNKFNGYQISKHETILFLDLPELSFFTLCFIVCGRHYWIISINAAWLKTESLIKDAMIFGKTSFWSFFTPNVARTYSSFAFSSSWYIPLGVKNTNL